MKVWGALRVTVLVLIGLTWGACLLVSVGALVQESGLASSVCSYDGGSSYYGQARWQSFPPGVECVYTAADISDDPADLPTHVDSPSGFRVVTLVLLVLFPVMVLTSLVPLRRFRRPGQSSNPPAAWYDIPGGGQRWFDGSEWTDQVQPETVA